MILGVGRQAFADDARIQFARAITAAEDAKAAVLRLIRWRDGQTENVELKLPVLGTYSDTAPYDCPKSKRIFEQGCRPSRRRAWTTSRHPQRPQRPGAAGQRQQGIPAACWPTSQKGGGIAAAGHVDVVLRLREPVSGRVCPGHRRPVDPAGAQTHHEGDRRGARAPWAPGARVRHAERQPERLRLHEPARASC